MKKFEAKTFDQILNEGDVGIDVSTPEGARTLAQDLEDIFGENELSAVLREEAEQD